MNNDNNIKKEQPYSKSNSSKDEKNDQQSFPLKEPRKKGDVMTEEEMETEKKLREAETERD